MSSWQQKSNQGQTTGQAGQSSGFSQGQASGLGGISSSYAQGQTSGLGVTSASFSQGGYGGQSSTYSQQGQSVVRRNDLDGQVLDILGDSAATLRWSQDHGGELAIISGGSNYSVLNLLKGSILKLWNEFFESQVGKQLSKDQQGYFQRRLINLERQVDGLLKRKIHFSVKDSKGGERFLDYSGLLNQKEVQIVELQKKIQNLEQRLRRASQREKDLETEIERLKSAMLRLQKPGVSKSDIEGILRGSSDYKALQLKYNSLKDRFTGFAGLLKSHTDKLRTSGSGITLDFETDLNALVRTEGVNVSFINGVANIVDFRDRVVQVPVSDARTKHLIHMFAVQMKKFIEKYPKLREQCDARLTEFFNQELIDIIQVDELDRVVQIVKYVPDIYRVENVYAYSSEKSRRVQFHLRVLLKALLEQFEKLKRKNGNGLVLDIDQGVIGMINAEIMDVVNVDDILKVFRVVPKIVEVEKIVEKIVDRIIQIPQVVAVEKIVEKIIEKPQIVEVERIVHVPVEVVKYVDVNHDKIVTVDKQIQRIVEVPRIVEKIVDRVVEIPKLVTTQVIVEKVIYVDKPTIVEKIINVPIIEYRQVEVIKEKIVTVERVVQKLVQVPVYVEKIVQVPVKVPQEVSIEVRNDVIVERVVVQNAREVVNHIQKVPQITEVTKEKVVVVNNVIEKIVQVPKVIQKIVQVRVEVPIIKQVKVIEEKIVYKDKIKQVQRVVNNTVQIIRQVQKIVDRRVEVPIVVEKIVRVPEIITQIVVQRMQNPVIVQVEKYVQKIVEVPKIIEVETVKTIEVIIDNPVKITVQKIVQVPKTIERIKEVRVNIDKIIQKMVEVPKVVQVEKIVQKVIVVPRVIEKVVEVPQIVEKIVDRIIETTKIVEVQRVVQVPMYQDRVKLVEVPVNTYITQKDIVQKIVEKLVPVEKVITNIQIVKQTNDKIIQHRVEVPRQITVDRIVPVAHQVSKVVQIEKQIIVPVEVPVPTPQITEKVVPIETTVQKIVQVPQSIEKIVSVQHEVKQVIKVVEIVQVPVFQETIRQIERVVPYIQTEIKTVQLITEKPVLNNVEVVKVMPVDRLIEKIVRETVQIMNYKDVERIVEKPIEVQKLITVQNFVPVLVEVNKIVEVYRDRPIQIPIIHQQIKQVKVMEEKVVAIEHRDTQIKQVITNHDKIVEQERLITKTDIRNQIDVQIKSVDRYEDKIVPITTSIEKIIEVPYILEKIVEKIVLMPQVVQVLKYVHEIVQEQSLGVAVGVDVYSQQTKYKGLYGKLKVQFEALLVQLRKLRGSNPALKIQIETIEAFLVELDKLIAFPRIVQVEKEKLVEVNKNIPILVPTLDIQSERFQITLSMIVGRLLDELMRVRQQNPSIKFNIDAEVLKIFSDQYRDKSGLLSSTDGKFEDKVHKVYKFYENFLQNLGGSNLSWEQQLMFSAALEQRLIVANLVQEANMQISKVQTISDKRADAYRVMKQAYNDIKGSYGRLNQRIGDLSISDAGLKTVADQLRTIIQIGYSNIQKLGNFQPMSLGGERQLYFTGNGQNDITVRTVEGALTHFIPIHHEAGQYKSAAITDFQFLPVLRARLAALYKENDLLRDKYVKWQKEAGHFSSQDIEGRNRIIDSLEKKIVQLNSELNRYKSQTSVSVNVSGNVQQNQLKIRTLMSKNQQLESQLRTIKLDYESKLKSREREIQQKDRQILSLQEKLKIGDSRVTGIGHSDYTPSSKTSLGQDRMSSSGYSGTSGSQGGAYGNYSSTGGSKPVGGASGSATYGSTGFTSAGQTGTGGSATGSLYGQSGSTAGNRYNQPSTLQGTGAGQTATSGLSGSGATYGQSGSSSSSGATYGQSGTGLSGSGVSGGLSYGQTGTGLSSSGVSGSSYGQSGVSSNVSYGQSGTGLSGSGASYGQSGTGVTGSVSYTQGGSGSGAVGGASYGSGSSTGGYSRNYGQTGTGVSGVSGVSGISGGSGTSSSSAVSGSFGATGGATGSFSSVTASTSGARTLGAGGSSSTTGGSSSTTGGSSSYSSRYGQN